MKKKPLLIASIGLTFSLEIGVVVNSGLYALRLLRLATLIRKTGGGRSMVIDFVSAVGIVHFYGNAYIHNIIHN